MYLTILCSPLKLGSEKYPTPILGVEIRMSLSDFSFIDHVSSCPTFIVSASPISWPRNCQQGY